MAGEISVVDSNLRRGKEADAEEGQKEGTVSWGTGFPVKLKNQCSGNK